MQYFNKGFFGSTLGLLLIITVSLFVIVAPSTYATITTDVVKIAFTTDAQTIKPNTLSGAITIQTQDSGGVSLQTPETIDLEFTSSSPTGEFLTSTGNPVGTTMSKNTANRTFYYRDSTEGAFTLTINATGRESGESWSANQQMIISASGSSAPPPSDDNPNNTSSGSGSSTSGPASVVSNTNVNSQLEITAGPDRLTAPGSPITFQVLVKKNSVGGSLNLSWSFGDGHVGVGDLVTHMYKYPGDYVVVQAKFIISKVPEKEAKEVIRLWNQAT